MSAVAAIGCGHGEHLGGETKAALRLNHIQVVGTHNSYHLEPPEPLFSYLQRALPRLALAAEYSHVRIAAQLESQAVRQLELDVYADPDGGLYASRAGYALVGRDPSSGIPELDRPGFKVLHTPDLDFESSCWTFQQCLVEIRDWSDSHPFHVPILILLEARDEGVPGPMFTVPARFGRAELDALEREIDTVFPRSKLITPDEVRGTWPTLDEAVRADGWPLLSSSRGRILFALANEDEKRDAYLEGHPALRGRLLFTSASPGRPEAAFVKLDDPIANRDRIRSLVAEGYLVRTRADADTLEARTGNTERREAALGSGAHFVSTDFPAPNPRFGTSYAVGLPEGIAARCNPVSAPRTCSVVSICGADCTRC